MNNSTPRSTNGSNNNRRTNSKSTNTVESKKKSSRKKKLEQIEKRPAAISKMLQELWEIKVKNRNDDYIVSCRSGKRTTDISLWPALRVQRARVCTNIDSKIRVSKRLKSDDEIMKDFIATQEIPVLSPSLCKLLLDQINSYFSDFDYAAVRAEVDSHERAKFITNGSSSPQLIAPVLYTNGHSNAELIAVMAVGEAVFTENFRYMNVFKGAADGKTLIVPKNYKTGRLITLPPREVTDRQMVIANALRDYATIKSRTDNHIIQFDDQSVQWDLLREGYATIDLSSASDRVYRRLLEKVWPEFMKHFGDLLPETVEGPKGRIIPLTSVGTQGFPLTFPLMAIICGLIVKAVKTSIYPSSNYGDDVIVHESDFEEVYTALESLGLKINRGKTHKSSDGFLESCGMDVIFTSNGRREVTPVYLRGFQDVEVIQFFHQLCNGNLINPSEATSIMDRLGVDYFAFEWDYQVTEFHLPHGPNKNVPRAQWDPTTTAYVCRVPFMENVVDVIKGLSKKESDVVMQLLHIEAGMKNPNIHALTTRGIDPVARPYALFDLQDHKLYSLYKDLSAADGQVLFSLVRVAEEYNISLKSLAFYHFITSEMYKYKFSSYTVDFDSWTTREITLSDFIESEFGIKSDVRYPIYRYQPRKSFKTIAHPKSNEILGVEPSTTVQ